MKKKIKIHDVLPFKGSMQVHQVIQIHKPQDPPSIIMKLINCFKCMDIHRESILSFECQHNTLGSIQYSAMEEESISHTIEV